MTFTIAFQKHSNFAVIPSRAGPNEIGYDLTIISKIKQINSNTVMYDTGISVKPPEGFYTEIVPRSSLIKTGWIMTNSVGIIDPTYRGTLKIVMTKVCQDDEIKELEMPFTKFQLIVRKMYVPEVNVEDNYFDETDRGSGGFGSTDN